MATDLSLRCACGALRGTLCGLTCADVNRLVCHCTDCRALARHLQRPDILDAHGGTDILQVSVARLVLTEGTQHLRCVRLSASGMHRWFAGCCQTPLGNTLGPGAPFIGVIDACVERTGDRHPYDALAPRVGVSGSSALGDRGTLDAHPGVPVGMMMRIGLRLLFWWLRGDARRSPFRISANNAVFRVTPDVLLPPQRAALADLA